MANSVGPLRPVLILHPDFNASLFQVSPDCLPLRQWPLLLRPRACTCWSWNLLTWRGQVKYRFWIRAFCFAFLLFWPSICIYPGFLVTRLKAKRPTCTQRKKLSNYSWKQKVVRGRMTGLVTHQTRSLRFCMVYTIAGKLEIVTLEMVALAVCVYYIYSTVL